MTIDQAEHIAAYLLDNGYHRENLANYSVDELQDIICGSIVNAMEAMTTKDSSDQDLQEYLADTNRFEDALRQEIQHRVEGNVSTEEV